MMMLSLLLLGPKVPHYAQTVRSPLESVRRRNPPVAVDESLTLHKSAESESHVDMRHRKSQSADGAVSHLFISATYSLVFSSCLCRQYCNISFAHSVINLYNNGSLFYVRLSSTVV